MWWDVFVPKVVLEERLDHVTQAFNRVLESEAAQIRALQCRLKEIEESAGWKLVLWSRKRFGKLCPPNSALNRLGRRAAHIWLTGGLKSLVWAALKKPFFFLGRRLRFRRSAAPIPVPLPLDPPAPPPSPKVVEPVAVPAPVSPVPVQRPSRMKKRFCVYTNSKGNYFFHEIRDLLAAGLEDLGFPIDLRSETDGFGPGDAWHVVIAPHEFFHLGAGQQLGQETLPAQLVVVNTEQPSTHWFRLSAQYFSRAHAIWDIDYLSAQRLLYQGWKCRYLALGHLPDFRPFRKLQDLPEHYGTCFLEPQVRQRSPLVEPLALRPIDAIFVGNPTPKRQAFYAAAAPVFARYHCYFHFSDGAQPLLAGKNTYMNTATVMGLVQRSKILLNIHRDADLYFEWQRIVMQGIWQKTLVISEPCSPAPPFRPGIDYVEASLAEISTKVEYYLSDPRGRQEAQAIATEGHRTLARDCRMRDVLGPLIASLESAVAADSSSQVLHAGLAA